jgi:hypothetical protein
LGSGSSQIRCLEVNAVNADKPLMAYGTDEKVPSNTAK